MLPDLCNSDGRGSGGDTLYTVHGLESPTPASAGFTSIFLHRLIKRIYLGMHPEPLRGGGVWPENQDIKYYRRSDAGMLS